MNPWSDIYTVYYVKAGKLHIGTSGWSYKEWKEAYYPKELKSTDWLSYYAKEFDCTEINASFYHLPQRKTIENWVNKVADDFKFCVKMSRYLTHMNKLSTPEEPLQRFFDVFDLMKEKMGPVLIQLPPSLAFHEEKTTYFYDLLKTKYSDYDFAMEVRHASWLQERSIELMEQYKIAFVISQSGVGFPYAEHVTAKDVYVRFHGPGKLYYSVYENDMLHDYAVKFKHWLKKGHNVWAFFNNTAELAALDNAKTLREMVR